ncbi:ATP-binding protein [Macrococcus armenti]|uniref:ATP-binding protein n=1 Tax=Macrococcus armenti TaxID=2875764 RepID=UPI001CCFA476|nr:ATP-binding protein [Macrococcus armenti]UBH13517.1 ATP-binding protein [Macrococcus armenti]
MRVDLHLHTKKCKKGDKNTRNVDATKFRKTLVENEIVIAAITNHNHFDLEQFYEFRSEEEEYLLLPGIELDIEDNNNKYHIIIVSNPSKASSFKELFDNELNRDYENYSITFDDLISKVEKLGKENAIIIPHFLDKDKKRAINIELKEQLKERLKGYIFILEPGSANMMGIINAHNEIALIGSDLHDWDEYPIHKVPEIKFKINSFDNLVELTKNNKHFINSYLKGTKKEKILVENNQNDKQEIDIYQDINVIFGEKGSGKTILLSKIKPQLISKGYNVIHHEGKDYAMKYSELIKDLEGRIDKDYDLCNELEGILSEIINYREDEKYRSFTTLHKYNTTEVNNARANKLQKRNTKYSAKNSDKNNILLAELKKNIEVCNKTLTISDSIERDDIKKRNLQNEMLYLKEDLYTSIKNRMKYLFINNQIEKFLDNVKTSINRQTGMISPPSNIGFANLVEKRLNYLEDLQRVESTLENFNKTEGYRLGNLPNKGDVILEVSIKSLDKASSYKDGFKRSTITRNRSFVNKIYDFNIGEFKNINEYIPNEIKEISVNELIGEIITKKSTVKLNNKEYKPSEGEQAILAISGLLEDFTYDVYLLDEIERGLGQKYLTDYIIPQLKVLRDSNKFIILSTHNSNLAINTLPSQTIYCNYRIGSKEIYYTGNMYSNELKSFDNSEVLDWNEYAVTHLEGTENMFKIRRNTYGI